tara:strand:+ start:248 stop:583 length:336 start_codon:yes stop_codon:yes gene_type:complete
LLLRTDDGVVVARLVNGILVKKARESKHMLRSPKAWAFDRSIIETASRHGATGIRIEAGDTGAVFKVSMDMFLEKSFALQRGHNRQLALVLKFWDTSRPEDVKEDKQLTLI